MQNSDFLCKSPILSAAYMKVRIYVCEGDGFMDKKKAIVEMINSISDKDILDYLYVLVKDVYQESCCVSAPERSPAALDLTS